MPTRLDVAVAEYILYDVGRARGSVRALLGFGSLLSQAENDEANTAGEVIESILTTELQRLDDLEEFVRLADIRASSELVEETPCLLARAGLGMDAGEIQRGIEAAAGRKERAAARMAAGRGRKPGTREHSEAVR